LDVNFFQLKKPRNDMVELVIKGISSSHYP